MKILDLKIKQKYFDAIMAGRKVQEFREVRPATAKKFVQLDEEEYEIEDEHGYAIPVVYDAIRFYVECEKNCDSALVEVTGAECQISFNADNEPITYEYDNRLWVAEQVVYNLGKILEHDIRDKSKNKVEY